jgi:hypothetical protein
VTVAFDLHAQVPQQGIGTWKVASMRPSPASSGPSCRQGTLDVSCLSAAAAVSFLPLNDDLAAS